MAVNPTAINDVERNPLVETINTFGNRILNLSDLVKFQAEQRAAETNRVVTITTDTGVTHTAQPPPRPNAIKTEATGGTVRDEDRKPDPSESGTARLAAAATVGTPDGDDEGNSNSIFGGIASAADAFKTGAERTLGGILPSMEAILLNVPSNLLGKFVQGLPPIFQSLTPPGALAGIVGSVVTAAALGRPVSLNNLVRTVAGAAVGAAAGQALRSVTNGIGLPAVSGLAGTLGAIAVNRVAQASVGAIPLNIASNTNPRARAGSTPQANAVLATVAGTVGAVAFSRVTQGIPVSPALLGLTANVALRSVGSQLNLPVPVLGLASNFASRAVSSIVGGVVAGRVPVLPSNLSLPLVGALSGIAQSISADLARTLIPAPQLQTLLPQNLQKSIPRVPPRINSPYVQNRIGVNRGRAREVYPPQGPRNAQQERRSTLGALQGSRLTGQERLSANYIVADMTTRARLNSLGGYILGSPSLTPAQLYENMKFTAENILELVRNQFPGFYINDGLRNGNGRSYHFRGLAVDLQWNAPNFSSMAERANWMYRNIPSLAQLLLETRGPGNGSGNFWIHIAVEQGFSGRPFAATCYAQGSTILRKVPYNNGFIRL